MSYRPPSQTKYAATSSATSKPADDGWTTVVRHAKPEVKSKWGQSALKEAPKKLEDEFPALGNGAKPANTNPTNKPSMAELMKKRLAEEEEERQRREAEELRKEQETEAERIRTSGVMPLYSLMRARVANDFREPEPECEGQPTDYEAQHDYYDQPQEHDDYNEYEEQCEEEEEW